jgi:hypothetical protein
MSEAIFGFIGVIVGALIPWIREWLREKKQRKEHAIYLAAQLICILDEYMEKCCDVVADDGTIYGMPARSDGTYFPQVATPELIYPKDIDWKSIEGNLMYDLLALPNNARKTDRYISNSADHASPPDHDELFEARWEGYANLGLKAISLTDALRATYKLPSENFEINPNWNAKQFLEEKITKLEQARKRRADAFEEMTIEIGEK